MSSPQPDRPISQGGGIWQNERFRRIVIHAGVLLGVFLLGLVPMWLTARTRAKERDAAQASLRISTLQNILANAAIDSRRGEYEPARQATSEFFTNLQAEIDRTDSVLTEMQRNNLRLVFSSRDDVITLTARSDPASADRLTDLYVKCRQAMTTPPAR